MDTEVALSGQVLYGDSSAYLNGRLRLTVPEAIRSSFGTRKSHSYRSKDEKVRRDRPVQGGALSCGTSCEQAAGNATRKVQVDFSCRWYTKVVSRPLVDKRQNVYFIAVSRIFRSFPQRGPELQLLVGYFVAKINAYIKYTERTLQDQRERRRTFPSV